ncbi:B3 domain-containing transcription factor VRN1 [Trifolium repens]|nr:B3 domain-containing transcription factor VRN1 [Trifolium repens]
MLAWYSSKKAAGLGPDLQMFESVISCCVNSKHFEIAGRVFEEMMIGSASSSTQKLNLKMASLSLSKDAVEGDGSTNDDAVQSPFTPSEDIVITNPVQASATKTVGLCCNCKGYQNAMCEYRGCRMIPRNFVESYWKDVSNPISLKLPNGSDCKMYWVQQGNDRLHNWKRFARSLRCGELLVFQYKGGSDFHVIIFDDSKLEIDYSKANRNREGRDEKAKKCTKTKDANERRSTNTHPHENPNFTLKLSRSNVEGDVLLNIPIQFSKEYKNELLQGNAAIRSAGEERTWHVTLTRDNYEGKFRITGGWKSFSQEHNLHVGDVCKFEMTQREPLSFTITITPSTKEPCPEQFQDANCYRGGMGKKVKNCTKTKDGNERSGKYSNPNENPSFTLTLPRSYVEGRKIRLNIPIQFSKEYKNELLRGNAAIRSAGEERTWHVTLTRDNYGGKFRITGGWKSFSQEHNLHVGDVCKFEMTQREPLSFTITITPSTKEPCPEQFQENRVHEKSETTPSPILSNLYGEGISRSCLETHGLKLIDLN